MAFARRQRTDRFRIGSLQPAGLCAALAVALHGMPASAQGNPVRTISPELVAPPEVDNDTLQREEPRAPLSDIGPAGAPRAPEQVAPVLGPSRQQPPPKLFRPVATAAGRLEAEGVVVVIAGIDIIEPNQTCGFSRWPCGASARTALRSFMRGRAVNCEVPPEDLKGNVTSACTVAGQDIGAWLVSNGWAKVALDGPYAEEQQKAVEARRGIFGPGPEALPPSQEGAPGQAAPGVSPPMAPGTAVPPASQPPIAQPPTAAPPSLPPTGGGLY